MRYRVSDLPRNGMAAFTPIPPPTSVASSYGLVKVTGAMGLLPVPVVSAAETLPPISKVRQTQGSFVAPNVILPDQYVAHADNMGPCADAGIGMAIRRNNPVPVPAKGWIPVPPNALRGRRFAGRQAMSWPRAFQRWGTQSQ
jgi:hypothetical protein